MKHLHDTALKYFEDLKKYCENDTILHILTELQGIFCDYITDEDKIWLRGELNGFNSNETLPEYRRLIICSFIPTGNDKGELRPNNGYNQLKTDSDVCDFRAPFASYKKVRELLEVEGDPLPQGFPFECKMRGDQYVKLIVEPKHFDLITKAIRLKLRTIFSYILTKLNNYNGTDNMNPRITINGNVNNLQAGSENSITYNNSQLQVGNNNVMITTTNDELLQKLYEHIDNLDGEATQKEEAKNLLQEKKESPLFVDIAKNILSRISDFNNIAQFITYLNQIYSQYFPNIL